MDLITITRERNLAFTARVRDHVLTSDMSEKDGGNDCGPAPMELLAASVGVCMTIMIQAYCQRHGWAGDVGGYLTVELADSPKRIDRIVVDLELPEGVPDEKRDAVRRMALACPIHETFRKPVTVDVDIA
jgi:putative redox protein